MFIFIGIHVYIFDKIGFDGGDVICFIVFSGSEEGFISLLRGKEFLPPALSLSFSLSLSRITCCSEDALLRERGNAYSDNVRRKQRGVQYAETGKQSSNQRWAPQRLGVS